MAQEVVARIPAKSLRQLCAIDSDLMHQPRIKEDKENDQRAAERLHNTRRHGAEEAKKTARATTATKKPTAREACSRMVAEIERLAVRTLCEHVSRANLVEAVSALRIDHAAAGNNPASKAVAGKRLFEHIHSASGGVGLTTYLEKEATQELLADLANSLSSSVKGDEREVEKTAEGVAQALEREAMLSFFESLPEEWLHEVCIGMNNESKLHETRSRRILAKSIISDRPVADIVASDNALSKAKASKKAKVPKSRPELKEGVTYEAVFQWYNVSELQEFAREQGIKVSGKKKELINRILAHLSGTLVDEGKKKKKQKKRAKGGKKQPKMKKESAGEASKSSEKMPSQASSSFQPNPEVATLLESIAKGCRKAAKGLTQKQIDDCEQKLKATTGKEIRFPDALRQLYTQCDGFKTLGFKFTSLINGREHDDIFLGLARDWANDFVRREGRPAEESVGSPEWLPITSMGEFGCHFVNVDPSSSCYGKVRYAETNANYERTEAESMEEMVKKIAAYIEKCAKVRARFAAEEPDADSEELDDWVLEDVDFGDEDDEEEDGEEDNEEDKDDMDEEEKEEEEDEGEEEDD